ncbi:MAG: electron transfer flavoprotein subunit beta/FixA family protein, partial [Actinomycetota bacterium]|nr:electron transfer flavoprotein subunit beta/FixA family protein [Actinomycetota bacterium]
MKILVLVKQVPAPGSVSFLPQLNRIAREGVASLLNPLDGHALEVAVEIAGPTGEVVAATMGPPQAREVLEDACARGASRGIHLVDPMFAGADTLATARAFASLVARERPDLVLGGRTTLDGATAQVVPQLAELAGLSLATEAEAVTVSAGEVEVTRRNGAFRERVRAPLPAVVSVVAAPGAPRAVP